MHDKPKQVYSLKNILFALDCIVCSILCDDRFRNDDNSKLACHFLISSTHQIIEIFQKGIKILDTIMKWKIYDFRYEKYTFWALICFFAQQYSLFGSKDIRKTSLLFYTNLGKQRNFSWLGN